jgi:hypothetical protein
VFLADRTGQDGPGLLPERLVERRPAGTRRDGLLQAGRLLLKRYGDRLLQAGHLLLKRYGDPQRLVERYRTGTGGIGCFRRATFGSKRRGDWRMSALPNRPCSGHRLPAGGPTRLTRARIPTVAWTIKETLAGMWLTNR